MSSMVTSSAAVPIPRRVAGIRFWTTAGLLVLGLSLTACGEREDPTTDEPPPMGTTLADWSDRLAEPSVPIVLAALAQPHAGLRSRIGVHTLRTTSDFTLTPQTPRTTEVPPVDTPVVEAQSIHDEVTLRWASKSEAEPAFALSQTNDHERGREVVVLGETVHVRLLPRGWFHYPRDSDVLEHWLDDAQRAPHDIVQLAAPRLAITAQSVEGGGLDGADAVEIALDLADTPDPALRASGPTQGWRSKAEIEGVTGTVRIDTTTGAWLQCDVEVRYGLIGADGAQLDGRVHVRGTVDPQAPPAITAPADSEPLPQRIRYEDQQRRLLDGLAAP